MPDESKSRIKKVPTRQRKKDAVSAKKNPRNVINLCEDTPAYDFKLVRFVDLFCGIGGFHVAMQQACADLGMTAKAVFASDIDKDCQIAYEANFSMKVHGDITKIAEKDVPFHDILVGGFYRKS
jgi:hypothetical protein